MKILKLLALVAVLGCSASVALADDGGLPDPSVTVNKKGDPLCNADGSTPANVDYTCFTTNSDMDPLIIPGDTDVNYVLASGSLSQLFVEVIPADPTQGYTCLPGDIFAKCQGAAAPPSNQYTSEWEFFDGTLTANTEINVSAPEPKGLLMLVAGLLPLFAFRKRIASRLSL